MATPLPPLNALRAFEATARHLSFTKAAEELNVTPAALSHQIRGLEAFLDCKLFVRLTRAIALTADGEALFPDVHAGFTSLRAGVEVLRQESDNNVLVVSAGPAFTAKWLAPRLYRFSLAQPEIDMRIAATLAMSDFKTDELDVAIRFGSGGYEGVHETKLFDELVIPLCSPRLLEAYGGALALEDLEALTLIHDDSLSFASELPGWKTWLEAAGCGAVDASRGLRFNHADHAIDAAVEGAGIVLARKMLAGHDLRSGRLVAPFGLELGVGRAFYLLCAESRKHCGKIDAFRTWVLDEVACMLDQGSEAPAGSVAGGVADVVTGVKADGVLGARVSPARPAKPRAKPGKATSRSARRKPTAA
ncbi:MAG: transcriptional regulator GcvA [Pseudomonadota bacterium]